MAATTETDQSGRFDFQVRLGGGGDPHDPDALYQVTYALPSGWAPTLRDVTPIGEWDPVGDSDADVFRAESRLLRFAPPPTWGSTNVWETEWVPLWSDRVAWDAAHAAAGGSGGLAGYSAGADAGSGGSAAGSGGRTGSRNR